MKLFTWQPEPPLSELVEQLWLVEADETATVAAPVSLPPRERVLPTGTMQLLLGPPGSRFVAYRAATGEPRRYRDAIFCGARSRPVVIEPGSPRTILGAHFKPGGAFPFVGSAGELGNTQVRLAELWGSAADELTERAHGAPGPAARLRLVGRLLRERLARAREPHPAVAWALGELERHRRVGDVVGRLALGARRFGDLFREQVGLTPKLFCRVRRFQRVLGAIAGGGPVDWADLALAAGYFDQSHLIRDFRLFSGLSPTGYLAARGEHRNHLALGR